MMIPAADEDRSRYFRTIARAFLTRRGAPFFLSPRDAEIISGWERRGIPLGAVLEGIERSFDKTRPGASSRGKVLSLAYCSPQVERSFDLHRERKVGARSKAVSVGNKTIPSVRETERFLDALPERFQSLAPIFMEGLDILSRTPVDEEALEALDDRVDGILWEMSDGEEREAAAADLLDRRPGGPAGIRPEVLLRAALLMRRRFRVPYLAPFHY